MVLEAKDIVLDKIKKVGNWVVYKDDQLTEPIVVFAENFEDLIPEVERQIGRKIANKHISARGIFGEYDGSKLIVANVIVGIDPDNYKDHLGKFFYENPEVSDNILKTPFFRIYEVTEKFEKEARLVRRYNKNRKRTEWALASRDNPKKVLRWFGPREPSKEHVLKEERRVQWFKHKGSVKTSWLVEEIPIVERKDEHPFTKDDTEIRRRWLSGPKDHLGRENVFGPRTDTEFGSGLLKKDKELYSSRWEHTETPQFREKYARSEITRPLSPPIIVSILEQLTETVKTHNGFVNFLKRVLDMLSKVGRGILDPGRVKWPDLILGAVTVREGLKKGMDFYLDKLQRQDIVKALLKLKEGIPNVKTWIDSMREHINRAISEARSLAYEYPKELPQGLTYVPPRLPDFPTGRMPERVTEVATHPTAFSIEEAAEYHRELPWIKERFERKERLEELRDQFNEVAERVINAFDRILDYVDRLLAWSKVDRNQFKGEILRLYDAVFGTESTKTKPSLLETSTEVTEKYIPSKIRLDTLEDYESIIANIRKDLDQLKDLYRQVS